MIFIEPVPSPYRTAPDQDHARHRIHRGPIMPRPAMRSANAHTTPVVTSIPCRLAARAGAAYRVDRIVKMTMPTTEPATASHMVRVGVVWVSRAEMRTDQITARIPMGCTTVIGARYTATMWMQAPNATSARPPSHTGVRKRIRMCDNPMRRSGDSGPRVRSTPTCWALAPQAKEMDARVARRTASGITGSSPPDLRSAHTARARPLPCHDRRAWANHHKESSGAYEGESGAQDR